MAWKSKEDGREYYRKWQQENREKTKEYRARWREKHRDKIREVERARRLRDRDKRNASAAIYREKNRDRLRAYNKSYYDKNKKRIFASNRNGHLKKKYGLTEGQFGEMFDRQEGRCGICGSPTKEGKRLHVDHCHATGKVRDLLCYSCNSGLGSFKDDVLRIEQAVAYLRRWQQQHSVEDKEA